MSTWGELGSRRTAVGECVLIICVGVSADRRMTMREGEASRKMRLAGLSGGNGEGGCEGGGGGGRRRRTTLG